MKTVTIVHLKSLISYPPVVSLIENLLDHGYCVNLVSYDVKRVKDKILNHPRFNYFELDTYNGNDPYIRIRRKLRRNITARKVTSKYMVNSDVLWTTTALSVQSLGKMCFNYKHVMQLMELYEWFPYIEGFKYWKFPIDEYARKAWRVVVPEVNRAYIEKTWWGIEKTPIVLPNKPYSIEVPESSEAVKRALNLMMNEKRKIILYLGMVTQDRNFEPFVEALRKFAPKYCLYIAGRPTSEDSKNRIDHLVNEYSDVVDYLGYFPAPQHLHLLKYAYIGLLPYGVTNRIQAMNNECSLLNSLYCAPNKIFEYSAFDVPMLGTEVPGLMQPFGKYNIGMWYDENDESSIIRAIEQTDLNHQVMSNNCSTYFHSIDLVSIVKNILME